MTGHLENVVAVEVTIDGMLVIADQLNLVEFPAALAIMPNIPQLELRDVVWEQVRRDLTEQGVLDVFGAPHPDVAAMIDTLSRPDRVIEARWWRKDLGGKMIRFVVCRKGSRHVVAARDGDMIVVQRVAEQVGLAAMVGVVLGTAKPADVEPLTAPAAQVANAKTPGELQHFGVAPPSARMYMELINQPTSWVELTASERASGGTVTTTEVAAGVLDSGHGRIVSIPRKVNGELFGSFLPGTPENLQRALDGLLEFLPAGRWFDQAEADTSYQD